MNAEQALKKLKDGSRLYAGIGRHEGDVSPEIRRRTAEEGQKPYAVIVTCSDSRVIPEAVFSAGIGELFVIRTAGNVIGQHELGSIEYALEHLHCPLVVVMGHTRCGAVGAALRGESGGYVSPLTEKIRKAVGDEKDPVRASCLNAVRGAEQIRGAFFKDDPRKGESSVRAVLYRIEDGTVVFDI